MATFDVKIEMRTGLARAWVLACKVAAPLIGDALSVHLATRGALRLVKWRVVGFGATDWRRGVRMDVGA